MNVLQDLLALRPPSITEVSEPAYDQSRQKMIDRIEGYFGTLDSIPYHDISTKDLTTMYTTLLGDKLINAIK